MICLTSELICWASALGIVPTWVESTEDGCGDSELAVDAAVRPVVDREPLSVSSQPTTKNNIRTDARMIFGNFMTFGLEEARDVPTEN
jgi:hypothetical protein